MIFSTDQRGPGTVAVPGARGPVVAGGVRHAVGVARGVAVHTGEGIEGREKEGESH